MVAMRSMSRCQSTQSRRYPSLAQAATCGVPFITAWDALERSHVKAGTCLLIIGAGAVAKAAQVLAEARGADVVMAARRADVVQSL